MRPEKLCGCVLTWPFSLSYDAPHVAPYARSAAPDAVRTTAGAAGPRAAANPTRERARRREITSEMMISLMSELPGIDPDNKVNTPRSTWPEERLKDQS